MYINIQKNRSLLSFYQDFKAPLLQFVAGKLWLYDSVNSTTPPRLRFHLILITICHRKTVPALTVLFPETIFSSFLLSSREDHGWLGTTPMFTSPPPAPSLGLDLSPPGAGLVPRRSDGVMDPFLGPQSAGN